MTRDEKLSLPADWEKILERMMLSQPASNRRERIYICSPCRAETAGGVIRNVMAARVYMFYSYVHFPGVPKAPHAYLPAVLSDQDEFERTLALLVGKQLVKTCTVMLVCGDRLSDGMYGEIKTAERRNIPIKVFSKQVYNELCSRLALDGRNPGYPKYECDNPHFALSWGADELAPYWEGG
jgi:hypothetical protein